MLECMKIVNAVEGIMTFEKIKNSEHGTIISMRSGNYDLFHFLW